LEIQDSQSLIIFSKVNINPKPIASSITNFAKSYKEIQKARNNIHNCMMSLRDPQRRK
jgi:hypothetical protein